MSFPAHTEERTCPTEGCFAGLHVGERWHLDEKGRLFRWMVTFDNQRIKQSLTDYIDGGPPP